MIRSTKFKPHPISIGEVYVLELSIKVNIPPHSVEESAEIPYSISVGHSEYDKEKKEIIVGLKLETERDESRKIEPPYFLTIEIVSNFTIDDKKFPIDHLEDWANRNAPFILYPYLREQAYALTLRCGYKPFILPLVEVPTFKLGQSKKAKSTKKSKSPRK